MILTRETLMTLIRPLEQARIEYKLDMPSSSNAHSVTGHGGGNVTVAWKNGGTSFISFYADELGVAHA